MPANDHACQRIHFSERHRAGAVVRRGDQDIAVGSERDAPRSRFPEAGRDGNRRDSVGAQIHDVDPAYSVGDCKEVAVARDVDALEVAREEIGREE